MNKGFAIVSHLMFGLCFSGVSAASVNPELGYPSNIENALEYVPNQLIVKIKSDVASAPGQGVAASAVQSDVALAALQQKFKLGNAKKIKQSQKNPSYFLQAPQSYGAFAASQSSFMDNLYVISTDVADIPGLAQRLSQDPNVEYAEPDYIVHADATPDDPYFSSLGSWGQSYLDLWGLHQLNAEAAWEHATGAGVIVAVVDSGVDFSSTELYANRWYNTAEIMYNGIDDDNNGYIDDYAGYDFVDNDTYPYDGNGHGTHVAGTIAAVGNNATGLIGVAYNAKIMALRGLNIYGSGSTSDLVAAMAYAVDNGAKVMNNSWGGLGSSKAHKDAVRYAYENNVITTVAAGNYNMDTMFASPANAPGAVTVAASDVDNLKASFSNWGHDVDIAAPGVDILSVNVPYSYIAQNRPTSVVDSNYLRLNGTSMATPHVSGVAALLLEAKPDLTVDQVRSILRESATAWEGYSFLAGPGVANADNALQYVLQDLPYANTFADIVTPMTMSLAGKQTLQLRGTANGAGFSYYEINIAEVITASNLTQFTLGDFTTVAMSSTPVTDGVLADVDLSGLTSGNIYLLQLKSYDVNGVANEHAVRVMIDETMASGFPVYLSDMHENLESVYSPVVIDLDDDGDLEMVTFSNRGLEALHSDGSSVTGFPVALPYMPRTNPTVVDIDADGSLDIIVTLTVTDTENGYLHVYDNQGQLKPGFPAVLADPVATEVVSYSPREASVADLDGDGALEIISIQNNYDAVNNSTPSLRLVVLDAQGQALSGYPKLLSHKPNGLAAQLALHDFNQDGADEMVLAYHNDVGTIDVAIYAGGSVTPVVTNTDLTQVTDSVLFQATEDGDVYLALVGGYYNPWQIRLYQVNSDYSLTQQWAQSLPFQPDHVIVHDMDGDNQLELITKVRRSGSAQKNDIWAYNLQGELMSGYPLQVFNPAATSGSSSRQGLTVAKIADYPNGVLMVSGVSSSLYALDMQGNPLDGWPKDVPYFQNGGDMVPADIDDDGQLDVLVNNYSGSLYAWTLGEAVLGPQPWSTPKADLQRSNFFAPVVYEANFDTMNVRGTFNSWGNKPMTLVDDHQWQVRVEFTQAGEKIKFDALGNWSFNWGDDNADKIADLGGDDIVAASAGTYLISFNDQTLAYSVVKKGEQVVKPTWQRTVIFIYGQTQSGQDMFIRGGIDHDYANTQLGRNCQTSNFECAIPISHNNLLNGTTAPWKAGDQYLDWYGLEAQQGSGAEGTALDWTTDLWPSSWGQKRTVEVDGYGETPLNLWGQHYWMLDVDMDCSKTVNGWFEIKSYISNGPGWEANVSQPGAPWASGNHFAQCGKLNVFRRGESNPVTIEDL